MKPKKKKKVQKLGLGRKKIDCYLNGCILYFKDDINERKCDGVLGTVFKNCFFFLM